MEQPIILWPEGAPGAAGTEGLDIPTLTPCLPPEDARLGAAIVVCPGGGYQHLADHEAWPVADWLNRHGIAAFVLKYRLAPRYRHPAPMLDAQRAIRTVRCRAPEWSVDRRRIGILGFSAGGHVASTAGTHFDAGDRAADDPVERVGSRPDLMVLIYAVISFTTRPHTGSRQNLLGKSLSPALVELLSNEKQVTSETPPAFLAHAIADASVPCENSINFARALREAGVPFELHVFAEGGHGLGLGADTPGFRAWPDLCAEWLRQQFGGAGGA